MKHLMVFLLFLFGCAQEGLKVEKTDNTNFEVSTLFEYDGITVYRFYDYGRYHYFTSKNECISSQLKMKGKAYVYVDENIKSE